MKNYASLSGMTALCTLLSANAAIAQDATDIDRNSEDEADNIVVVGSRTAKPDLSARVNVISAEDIKAQGLTTLEEVIRAVPQNYSTINGVTNTTNNGPTSAGLGNLGLGVSAANLRGLGSANTLVLLNGRRLAGAAGQEDLFANLRDIPASAIERIEVLLDSGSAIYGADAVAGVINIVLKKNYTGATATARFEKSSTDADLKRFSGYLGYAWGTGSSSVSVSYSDLKPISSEKAGFVTRDHSGFLGVPAADRRSALYRSGAVDPNCDFGFFSICALFPNVSQILPPGNDGTSIMPGDFIPLDPDRDLIDFIEPHQSGREKDYSIFFSVKQTLFEGGDLRGEVLYTDQESVGALGASSLLPNIIAAIPASNAFNPFGVEVGVNYFPLAELQSGLISPREQSSENSQFRFNVGFDMEFSDAITWISDYTRSVSKNDSVQFSFAASIRDDLLDDDALDARLMERLASSDPNVAVNFFGDGSAQTDAINDFIIPIRNAQRKTVSEIATSYFQTQPFALPAGDIEFVFGGELRNESFEATGSSSETSVSNLSGAGRPSQKQWALFGEVVIPIFGGDLKAPGMQRLDLTVQARYDRYKLSGRTGAALDETEINFDNLSPSFGIAWQPAGDLLFRARYSEGFRAPAYSDVFATFSQRVMSSFVFDPLSGTFVTAFTNFGGANLDLKPETSKNITVGLEYSPEALEGLHIQLDYSRIKFSDRIATSFELQNLLPAEVYGNLDFIFQRDPQTGQLIEMFNPRVNISSTTDKTFDADVSYTFDNRWGNFTAGVNTHYRLSHVDRATPEAEEVDIVGTLVGLDRYRLQGRLNWADRGWNANLFVTYTPGYTNNTFESNAFINIPNREVDARTVVDLTVGYNFDNGLSVQAGARNLLNADFPFALGFNGAPYDARRVDLRGRVAFIELSYDFSDLLD